MKEYYVIIEEYLKRKVEIKANSKEEAEEIIKKQYYKDEICLNYTDWKDTKFNVIEKEV